MARLNATTYEDLLKLVTSRRRYYHVDKGVRIGHNTYAKLGRPYDPTSYSTPIQVTYHDTVIAHVLPNSIKCFTNGYTTPTTKDRLNQLIPGPYRIFQEHHEWFIYDYVIRSSTPWQEGITISW